MHAKVVPKTDAFIVHFQRHIKYWFQPEYIQRYYLRAVSKSAAHSAAPTVFVNEKAMEAKGIISRKNETIPSLVRQVNNNPNKVSISNGMIKRK